MIFSSFFVETTTAEENGFCNNAADCAQVDQQIANNANSSSSAGGSPVTVIVTEKVPGATCTCIVDGNIVKKDDEGNDIPPAYSEANCGDPKTRKYQCTVEK